MTARPLAVLAAAVIALGAVGCGDEITEAQDRVDEVQRNVDRATDAIQDPAGALEREAQEAVDGAIEDAIPGGASGEGE